MSLKDALDAAHGHEHNEDGSEMTPAQKAAKQAHESGEDHHVATPLWHWIVLGWATFATLLALVLLQSRFRNQSSS
jgi:hypothetical protein